MQEITLSFKTSELIIINTTTFILNAHEKKQIQLEFQEFCRKTFRALGKIKIELVITSFKMMSEFKTINAFLSFPEENIKTILNHGDTDIVFDSIIFLLSEWNRSAKLIIRSIKVMKAESLEDISEYYLSPLQDLPNNNSPLPRNVDIDQVLEDLKKNQKRGK